MWEVSRAYQTLPLGITGIIPLDSASLFPAPAKVLVQGLEVGMGGLTFDGVESSISSCLSEKSDFPSLVCKLLADTSVSLWVQLSQ